MSGIAGLMFGGAALAGAQTFPQVAPNQPPKSPPAQVAPALVKKIGRETSGNAVVASRLAGLRFVSSAREVQANGFKGVQAIDPGDVKFAAQPDFAPVVQPFLGQPVTLVSLDKLTSAVVAYYRRHDRPIVNVFAPQQNITNGYVQIVVAEGHVGDVTAKGATWFSNDDLRSDLRLRAGDPISGQVLRDDLDWMNRNPFHQSDVVFGPGDSPGLTDITLKTADRFPVRFFAGYDDAGNQFTGDYRYFTGFNYGDLFGLGQQISYQFSTAEDTNEFTAHSGSWIIPLPWRHILTIYGDYGQSSANVPGTAGLFHSSGVSWQTSLRYEVPLRAPTNMTHSLIAGFDFKESNNNLAFGGVPVALGAETADTAQFVVGYQAAYTDPYGSTSGSIMAFLSPGDLTSADSTAAYQSQRFAAKPAYEYGQLTLQRTTTLPWDFTWTERGQLQISDQNLLPSEQIGLGGYDTVRGYDEREATGDSGFYVSSELATPPISLGNLVGLAQATDRCQFLGFVDYGGTTLHNPGPADTNPNTNLLGIGPGVRYDITPYVSFRFDYGFQLIKTGFDSRYDSRGHIGLVMSLPGGPDERASTPPASGRPGMPAAIPGFLEQVDTNQAGTGANVNVYGGLTAFQNSTATLDSDAPISPNSLSADQQSEVGGVGGLHAGYTWKDFTDTLPLFMPALDGDFFWAGYKYKTEATTPAFSGSFLSSNANTYSLLVEPKMKFNLGSFRPYVGGGFGGTFIQADGSNTNLVNALGHISESSSKSLDAGCFSVEGLAGLEYFFDPHWAMTFEYKYLYMDEQGSVHSSLSVGGTKVHLMYNLDGLGTNLFTGGLSYYF